VLGGGSVDVVDEFDLNLFGHEHPVLGRCPGLVRDTCRQDSCDPDHVVAGGRLSVNNRVIPPAAENRRSASLPAGDPPRPSH
jgi:hypothetical protein